ncbi:SUMO family protein SMT3 [Sugiyamaella lignohabitans]|uniref:SUMO family protein SMT3 n=1 Tax=Sugiyamaella lignohabitans TaxID=796027 RepID=A0A167FRZ3_9ASCO|nr:SUMO family protein SMT3 [Sugiyamaella lignohabitans]ANB15626.1 SUMO family protein SMT3 [Sugiyamaella lignohabitans]
MSTPPPATPQEDAAVKSDVKAESTEHINVKVTDGSTEVFFKIKKTTPLRKVIDAFCKRTGKDSKALRFLFDGERITEQDTPASVSIGLASSSLWIVLRVRCPLPLFFCAYRDKRPCDRCTNNCSWILPRAILLKLSILKWAAACRRVHMCPSSG